MEEIPPPQLSKQELVDMGGWAVYREATDIIAGKCVKKIHWTAPVLTGLIRIGGAEYCPRLNLRSLVFPENKCSCTKGRQGFICSHAVALCMQIAAGPPVEDPPPAPAVLETATVPAASAKTRKRKRSVAEEEAPVAVNAAPPQSQSKPLEFSDAPAAAAAVALSTKSSPIALSALAASSNGKDSDKAIAVAASSDSDKNQSELVAPKLQSIRVSTTRGLRLFFRLYIPPNIATTAPRDNIVVKLEAVVEGEAMIPEKIDRSRVFLLDRVAAGVALTVENWCGGRLLGFMQLKRQQLQTLLNIFQNQPLVYWINKPEEPIAWVDGRLPGVSEHLLAPAAPTLTAEHPRKEVIELPKAPAREEVYPPYPKPFRYERPMIDGSSQYLSVTSPHRDDPLYEEFTAMLRENQFVYEPSNGRWWLRDQHKVLNFLAKEFGKIGRRYQVTYSENFKRRTAHLRRLRVHTIIRQKAGVHSLEMNLKAEGIPPEVIMQNVAIGRYYVMKADKIVLLDPEKIDAIVNAQRAVLGQYDAPLNPQLKAILGRRDLVDVHNELRPVSEEYNVPNDWTGRIRAIKEMVNLPPAPLPRDLVEQLRPYQLLGISWLFHLFQENLGAVLADEMGLGKTIQALGLILAVKHLAEKEKPQVRPPGSLVVCPASLVENWRREAMRFAPSLKVFVHHRDHRLEDPKHALEQDLTITSYTTLARDCDLFRACDWKLVVADEAQHIKNRQTQHARALRSLYSEGRFVLTGTPIENSLEDLRSIFEFIMPDLLVKIPETIKSEDKAWFDERHRKQAAPYILRRTKAQVAPELPEKITQVMYCELSPRQRQLYDSYRQQSERELFDLEVSGASEQKLRFAAFTQLLRLRQICAEPRIIDPQLDLQDSCKLEALDELLDESFDGDHRLLVFSQFVSVLGYLRQYLEKRGVAYCYLDGSTVNRQAVVDRYNNDPSIPVFLISLKAGGLGLNLTGADTVVHFDPWWNPAVEAQATDRAHRIGQTKVVTSVKLIATGTIEEKVLEMQKSKLGLLEALFEETAEFSNKISLAEIKDLLKS